MFNRHGYAHYRKRIVEMTGIDQGSRNTSELLEACRKSEMTRCDDTEKVGRKPVYRPSVVRHKGGVILVLAIFIELSKAEMNNDVQKVLKIKQDIVDPDF